MRPEHYVVDTNVAVVANSARRRDSRTPQALFECASACVEILRQVRDSGVVVLDDAMEILDEYRRNLSPSGQPGVGDAFFKWLWSNQANPTKCLRVAIHRLKGETREYAEFPASPELERFDRSDRKFVAVALASGRKPLVLDATDRDWWEFRLPLRRHGLRLKFLCPDLVSDR